LNRICSYEDGNYLEVGLMNGSTFIPAIYNNKVKGLGIEINPNQILMDNLKELIGDKNRYKIEFKDSWEYEISKNDLNSISVFFYDGDHSPEGQKKAFTYFEPMFKKRFVMIIDDWNEVAVREPSLIGLKESGYKVLYHNDVFSGGCGESETWWNGIGVFFLEK
jgi:hypothetical protein